MGEQWWLVPHCQLCPSQPHEQPAGLQGQHRAEPLGSLRSTLARPETQSHGDTCYSPSPTMPSCKPQDIGTRTCRTPLQVGGIGAPWSPLPTPSPTCSSAPHTRGWTQLIHPLPALLWAS